MKDKLEIALKKANEELVSLQSMSPDALESFMTVMSSLKGIVLSVAKENELVFSIIEGSAACAVEAPHSVIDLIYDEIDIAVRGESDSEDITSNLRSIQDEIKKEGFDYRFLYKKNTNNVINIHTPLKNATRISLKRKKLPYLHKLKIVSGFLNQIGGKDPNYHFYIGDERVTIACTINDARVVNQYLYQNVQSLLRCKEWEDSKKKDEYTHIAIVEDEILNNFKSYLSNYNKEEVLVDKLSITYKFVDEIFEHLNGNAHEVLKKLLIGFNDKNFHLSEIKTLLVISKPFKEHETIKEVRAALLETYQKKRMNA